MARVFFLAQSLFSLWMLVDAVQQRRDRYWYFIIMMPFGEVAYFFAVKIHDPEFRALADLLSGVFRTKLSLEQRERLVEETPSFANQLVLAQAYFDEGRFADAERRFKQTLDIDPENENSLWGLGLSCLEQRRFDAAAAALGRLVQLKPSFGDYEPWHKLAYALLKDGKLESALEVLDRLVGIAPRLLHRLTYANYLRAAHRHAEAKEQLERGLLDYETAPSYQRRQDKPALSEARALLSTL